MEQAGPGLTGRRLVEQQVHSPRSAVGAIVVGLLRCVGRGLSNSPAVMPGPDPAATLATPGGLSEPLSVVGAVRNRRQSRSARPGARPVVATKLGRRPIGAAAGPCRPPAWSAPRAGDVDRGVPGRRGSSAATRRWGRPVAGCGWGSMVKVVSSPVILSRSRTRSVGSVRTSRPAASRNSRAASTNTCSPAAARNVSSDRSSATSRRPARRTRSSMSCRTGAVARSSSPSSPSLQPGEEPWAITLAGGVGCGGSAAHGCELPPVGGRGRPLGRHPKLGAASGGIEPEPEQRPVRNRHRTDSAPPTWIRC